MKEWILRFRAKDRADFLEVKERSKTIETRAATPKHRKIKSGDVLIFVCGKERLRRKVKKVRYFKSINSMVKSVNYKKIMPSLKSPKEMIAVYHSYSHYKEKIKKYGLVAWDIK